MDNNPSPPSPSLPPPSNIKEFVVSQVTTQVISHLTAKDKEILRLTKSVNRLIKQLKYVERLPTSVNRLIKQLKDDCVMECIVCKVIVIVGGDFDCDICGHPYCDDCAHSHGLISEHPMYGEASLSLRCYKCNYF